MANTTFNTILLQINERGANRPIFEGVADAAITPGELLTFHTDGELKAHATAGGNALPMFAVEDPYNGDTANPAIDVDYATGETTRYVFAQPGDVVYAFLADGENVARGDMLESDGAGALKAHTARAIAEGGSSTYTMYIRGIVASADEALNNSAGGQRNRIKARVV